MGVRGSFRRSPFGGAQGLAFAVTSWLRVSGSTVTGVGISRIPEEITDNSAVQTTDAQRPALGNSANGLGLITGASGKVLLWPLTAANNGTSQWGIGCHIRTGLSAAVRTIFGVRTSNGASALRTNIKVEADESVRATIYIDDSNSRAGTTAISQVGDSTVHFLTVEFDGTQAAEAAKLTITLDGLVKALTFANEAGTGAMPATMVAATGSALIGAFNTAGSSAPFTGFIGPNIYSFGSKMAGATEGLLTPGARAVLSAFERPT